MTARVWAGTLMELTLTCRPKCFLDNSIRDKHKEMEKGKEKGKSLSGRSEMARKSHKGSLIGEAFVIFLLRNPQPMRFQVKSLSSSAMHAHSHKQFYYRFVHANLIFHLKFILI